MRLKSLCPDVEKILREKHPQNDTLLSTYAMEGEMNKEGLKRRTKQFALRVARLVEALPKSRTTEVFGRQLLRSGTSVEAMMSP